MVKINNINSHFAAINVLPLVAHAEAPPSASGAHYHHWLIWKASGDIEKRQRMAQQLVNCEWLTVRRTLNSENWGK